MCHFTLLTDDYLIRCQADLKPTASLYCHCYFYLSLSLLCRYYLVLSTKTSSLASYSELRPHLTSWAPYLLCLWRRGSQRNFDFEFIELFITCSLSLEVMYAGMKVDRFRLLDLRQHNHHPLIRVSSSYSWSVDRPPLKSTDIYIVSCLHR